MFRRLPLWGYREAAGILPEAIRAEKARRLFQIDAMVHFQTTFTHNGRCHPVPVDWLTASPRAPTVGIDNPTFPYECAGVRKDAIQTTLLKISGYTNLFIPLVKLQIHRRLITKPVPAVGFCLKQIIIGYCQHLFEAINAKIVIQAYAYGNLKIRMYD